SVWRKAEGIFGSFLRFILLTAARRSEAGKMTWGEIADGVWTLPAVRNKTKIDLVRPLSDAALSVLAELQQGKANRAVFSVQNGTALTGYWNYKLEVERVSGVRGWTIHDLRRTARSLMSRAGVNADIAERCLGHVIGGVRGIYDRHEYFEEKKRAFEALSSQIERIVNPQTNVVPMRGER